MDRRTLQERRRRKQRQLRVRRITRLGIYAAAIVLAIVFVVRGIIFPLTGRGTNDTQETTVQQEEIVTEEQAAAPADDGISAVRVPLKGAGDTDKLSYVTPGWHDSDLGRWYQNADGTYFADGFQEIDGVGYAFDKDGHIRTGWITLGPNDYYFGSDGAYDETKKKPMLALTFDDGPSEYTDELLDCLMENGAHATFFMLGECVEVHPDAVKKMVEAGCELGNHSYNHPQLTSLDYDSVAKQFNDTDMAVMEICGQTPTVCRAPYGSGNTDIYNIAGRPFFLWSLDSLDWSLLDVDLDYDSVMNGDLSDGTIILMHDIHQPSVQAALRIIPELVSQGYKLVTVSEMAAAKGVDLQNTAYSDFWQSSLDAGIVPGYTGNA